MFTESQEQVLAELGQAGHDLAEATRKTLELEDHRASEKLNAILRLVGTENPASGKPYSATAAQDFVGTDAQYLAYLARQREAEVAKITARARYDVAKAKLALLAQGVAA